MVEPPEVGGRRVPDPSEPLARTRSEPEGSSVRGYLRRFRKWIVAGLVAAIGGGIFAVVQSNVESGVKHLQHAVFDTGPAPPFTVAATLGPPANLDYCGGVGVVGWVFSQPSGGIRPPTVADVSDPSTLTAWAARSGGVPAGGSFVRMTITATSHDAIVLEAMRVVVVHRAPVRRGTTVEFSGGCGGLTSAFFTTNLDRQPPGAVVAKSASSGPPDFKPVAAVPFPHQVSASEPEELDLELDTATCTCDVYVLIDWNGPTASGTLAVKDHEGKPFRIAAAVHTAQISFPDYDHHAWRVSPRPKE
jgi:hypothetical protein